MTYGFLDIASTPSVRAAQEANSSRELWQRFDGDRASDQFTENEIAYIEARDSFYLASVSESGWPYVQHRGGPTGFLKVLDETTLGFADFRGNRQYISLGNISADDRVRPDSDGLPEPRASQDSGAHGGARTRRRVRSRLSSRSFQIQGKARASLPVASGNLRLELPATHHPAFHSGRNRDCGIALTHPYCRPRGGKPRAPRSDRGRRRRGEPIMNSCAEHRPPAPPRSAASCVAEPV